MDEMSEGLTRLVKRNDWHLSTAYGFGGAESSRDHFAEKHMERRGILAVARRRPRSNSSTLLDGFHLLLAIFTLAWMTNGLFSYAMPFVPNVVRYGLYGIWFGLASLDRQGFLRKLVHETYPLLYLLMYLSVLTVLVDEPYIAMHRSAFVYLFMIYSIYVFYMEEGRIKARTLILLCMCVEIVYVASRTFLALRSDPAIARLLAIGAENAADYTSIASLKGLGGYAFIYALVPIILLLTNEALKGGLRSLIFILAVAGLALVVIQAAYTLAILLMIASSSILIVYSICRRRRAVFLVVVVLGTFAAVILRPLIVSVLLSFAQAPYLPEVVAIRILELSDFLGGSLHGGSDLATRLDIYSSTWMMFVDNLIFGLSSSSLPGSTVRGHSAWLDMLAYFGVFALALFLFLRKSYLNARVFVGDDYLGVYSLCWIYFLVLGFVNTLFFGTIFAIWFVFLPFAMRGFSSAFHKPELAATEV